MLYFLNIQPLRFFYVAIIFTKNKYYYIIYLANLHYSDMSPYNWNSSNSRAYVFIVNINGYLGGDNVNDTIGLRPISFFNSHI